MAAPTPAARIIEPTRSVSALRGRFSRPAPRRPLRASRLPELRAFSSSNVAARRVRQSPGGTSRNLRMVFGFGQRRCAPRPCGRRTGRYAPRSLRSGRRDRAGPTSCAACVPAGAPPSGRCDKHIEHDQRRSVVEREAPGGQFDSTITPSTARPILVGVLKLVPLVARGAPAVANGPPDRLFVDHGCLDRGAARLPAAAAAMACAARRRWRAAARRRTGTARCDRRRPRVLLQQGPIRPRSAATAAAALPSVRATLAKRVVGSLARARAITSR